MTMFQGTLTALALICAMGFSGAAKAEGLAGEDVTAAINSTDPAAATGSEMNNLEPAAGNMTAPGNMMNPPSNVTASPSNVTTPDISGSTSNVTSTNTTASTAVAVPELVDQQKMAMRKLWDDQMVFTRNYVISDMAGLRDLQDVTDRLNKNQDDIGEAIKPFYGDDAGKKMADLMHTHIMNIEDAVKAVKLRKAKSLDDAKTKAYGSADDVASFLSAQNANLTKDEVSGSLHQEVDAIVSEAASRDKKDWKSDIDAYDQGREHILQFSDALVDGIAKQHPDKFTTAMITTPAPAVAPAAGP